MTGWELRDQRQALSLKARNLLRALALAAIPHGPNRNLADEYRELLYQGLAFQSHHHFSITTKGEDVAERCT